MQHPIRVGRSLTCGGLLLLLTAPLAIASHVHPAGHDGGVHHVEAPHGDHDVLLVDDSDRLPSTLLDRPISQATSTVHAPLAATTRQREPQATAADLPSARGPPRQHPSRAPPILP